MNIDSIKRFVLAGMIVIGTGLSVPAVAQGGGGYHSGGGNYYHGGGGYYRGGGYHGGGWGGSGWWGLGIGLGLGVGYAAATYADSYYYPSYPAYYYPTAGYYYPPTAYYPVAQPVVAADPYYPQQPVAVPVAGTPPPVSQASNWYYCVPTKGYYPNVRQCSEPWRIVPATPSGPISN